MSLEAKTGADEITKVLGYLNFSSGSFDANFVACLDRLACHVAESAAAALTPVAVLHETLSDSLHSLGKQNGTFRDCRQAERAIHLVFQQLLPAYREFHR